MNYYLPKESNFWAYVISALLAGVFAIIFYAMVSNETKSETLKRIEQLEFEVKELRLLTETILIQWESLTRSE